MNKQEQIIRLRSRKLGALLYDARLATRRKADECARAMNVSVSEYMAFEKGERAPSLPALEALAYYLNIPLEHFWGNDSLVEKPELLNLQNSQRLRQLRNRFIGAHLRQQRNESNLPLKDIAEITAIPEETLKRYELGQEDVPLPHLELISKALGLPMDELYDQHGPIGAWRNHHEAVQSFAQLPTDIQTFVCLPVNKPYIELAMRLSELNVEKLRAVAEGLLEITY